MVPIFHLDFQNVVFWLLFIYSTLKQITWHFQHSVDA